MNVKKIELYNLYIMSESYHNIICIYLGHMNKDNLYYFYDICALEDIQSLSEIEMYIEIICNNRLSSDKLHKYRCSLNLLDKCSLDVNINKYEVSNWYLKNRLLNKSLPILE